VAALNGSEDTYYCDEECNICGYKRNPHIYSSQCDPYCNNCGNEREVNCGDHVDADEDKICDICKTRFNHSRKYLCEMYCDVCHKELECKQKHRDDDDDDICNRCGKNVYETNYPDEP
jgi:hypothetical protein